MKSDAVDVAGYIGEQEPEWRDTLVRLRQACHHLLPGYSEEMAHGMPTYRHSGRMEVAFAKQATYLSLYVLKEAVLDAHRPRLEGLDLGKGCVRYRRPEQVDWSVVADLLTATAVSDDAPC
jgi:uncharacterized protein YdhG (YjbR/CyaY superfamily)